LVYEYDYPNRKKTHYDDDFKDVSGYAAKMLEESEYKIGDWVQHEKFGKGQILGVEKSAAGTKLSVFFKSEGLKKLIAEYANLQLLDS
jgi:hypothetical protein